MRIHPATVVILCLLLGGAAALGFMAVKQGNHAEAIGAGEGPIAVAVQTSVPRSGVVRDIRTLSGTLEASTRFVVAAKAAGLLNTISVDISDEITRGQVVARIDDRSFVQAIAQAQAELAVREAERNRAQSDLEVAQAEYERDRRLRDEGVSSESEYDAAVAAFESAKAERAVADARVAQARAALEIANIRLDDTRVRADWAGGADTAVVGERYQESGNTVGVGDPIISGVVIDPIRAVVFVTERDYGRLRTGQAVTIEADGLRGRAFEGRIERISPVFREASRQARVEILADNPDGALKPGMFARVRIVLEEHGAHTIVPLRSVRTRDGERVVFVVNEAGDAVRRVPVQTGISQGNEIEIVSPNIDAPVVTLGHQLLDDGSPVNVANEDGLAYPTGDRARPDPASEGLGP